MSRGPATMPWTEDFLPNYDVGSEHSVVVARPPEVVYPVVRRLDLSSSTLIRLLFRLRGLPASALTADGLARLRFKPLLEDAPEGFVLGLIGRFWTPSGELLDFRPERFADLQVPGSAKAVWIFHLEPVRDHSTRLRTATRVACTDASSRRSFHLYWTFVGPFSAVIRRETLRVLKEQAEALD